MKKIIFSLFLSIWVSQALSATVSLELEKAPVNPNDLASIKRGAGFFAANCMSCHTLIYLKNDTFARKQGILYEKMPVNIKNWYFGTTPPDLSLEAKIRGVDWIYTYLHSFYVDASRSTGANNLLLHNTQMPNILLPYQGKQVLSFSKHKLVEPVQWYDLLTLVQQGTMTPEQFDAMTIDVVNFLAYAADPNQVSHHRLGLWVLIFLIILFLLTWALKREYWRDVK